MRQPWANGMDHAKQLDLVCKRLDEVVASELDRLNGELGCERLAKKLVITALRHCLVSKRQCEGSEIPHTDKLVQWNATQDSLGRNTLTLAIRKLTEAIEDLAAVEDTRACIPEYI